MKGHRKLPVEFMIGPLKLRTIIDSLDLRVLEGKVRSSYGKVLCDSRENLNSLRDNTKWFGKKPEVVHEITWSNFKFR